MSAGEHDLAAVADVECVQVLAAADVAEMIPLPGGWADKPWERVRGDLVTEIERRYLATLLKTTGGRVAEAAKWAGMDSRSVFDKMKAHKLREEDFR